MTRNIQKIRAGLMQLTQPTLQMTWGTVVPGSYDAASGTVDVLPIAQTEAISRVLLHAVPEEGEGLILVPADGSYVLLGSVEGSGQWVVLKTGELSRAEIILGNANLLVDEHGVQFSNSSTVVKVRNKIEISAAGENLHGLLKDLLTAIKMLTVTTPAGPSSVPVNVADFVALEVRVDNFLQA